MSNRNRSKSLQLLKNFPRRSLSAKEVEHNVLAVLRAADFVRQIRLHAKPWKRTRTS